MGNVQTAGQLILLDSLLQEIDATHKSHINMGNVQTAGPKELMVIREGSYRREVIDNWAWVWWFSDPTIVRLTLEGVDVVPQVERIHTTDNVPIVVNGDAKVYISVRPEVLESAMENFCSIDCWNSEHKIKSTASQILEGYMRRVLETLTKEEAFEHKDEIASRVIEAAEPQLSGLGLEIVSFKIRDVYIPLGI